LFACHATPRHATPRHATPRHATCCAQLSRLHALEGHHEEVKQELEKSIQSLRAQISKYDADYSKSLEVLGGVSDNLMNLLRSVSDGNLLLL
jgi:hypothetical protein